MEESRVDILVVGDKINKTSLQNAMQDIESQIGKELSYAVFNTEDFSYRLDICDKLVRDILDYPHRKILKKLVSYRFKRLFGVSKKLWMKSLLRLFHP